MRYPCRWRTRLEGRRIRSRPGTGCRDLLARARALRLPARPRTWCRDAFEQEEACGSTTVCGRTPTRPRSLEAATEASGRAEACGSGKHTGCRCGSVRVPCWLAACQPGSQAGLFIVGSYESQATDPYPSMIGSADAGVLLIIEIMLKDPGAPKVHSTQP
jgi:hypothetical protein